MVVWNISELPFQLGYLKRVLKHVTFNLQLNSSICYGDTLDGN